jgi:23S rRNA (cytidine1920-2'-O)/16S rRNA (cytidine1409-2'-O)-methyltransferase
MPRRRLDAELVRRGLAGNTDEAAAAVAAGSVTVGGAPSMNPAALVSPGQAVRLLAAGPRFVSRGGDKLAAALTAFDVDAAGRDALDAGASTGGFTDCLLREGAARVIAVDVGYGQLAWSLRTDPRVVVLERTNVRDLDRAALAFVPDLVVADLSFVALAGVVPDLVSIASGEADLLLLVKPQFEIPAGDVPRGGVVRDPAEHLRAIERVASACRTAGAGTLGVMTSPIAGRAGNVEFLLHARVGAAGDRDVAWATAIPEPARDGGA